MREEVLLLDSAGSDCRHGQCGRIGTLVQSSLARPTVRLRGNTLKGEAPGLIIIRSDGSEGVMRALFDARTKWQDCPVFGLFCGAGDVPVPRFEGLNDFA